MQAIVTKFIGPTNHKGARIKASAQANSVTVSYEYGADGQDGAHDLAAKALIREMGWFGTWIRGATPDGCGNVYVCLKLAHTQGTETQARKLNSLTCLDSFMILEGEES